MKKYFDILGLEENSTFEEVRTARINLLKKYHPDLHVGNPKYAKMKTEGINEAFDNLKTFFETKGEESEITVAANASESTDDRVYEPDAKEKALEKLNEKIKNKKNRFSGKNLLDISIMVLLAIVIILFFVLLFT